MRVIRLKSLAEGPVNHKSLKQIQDWIDADWESHDVDRDAVKLIGKLVAALVEKL